MVAITILSACSTMQETVVEKFDEQTAVTITYNQTPFTMAPDRPFDRPTFNDYVQIGAIEVNRAGTLTYYLWLGISDGSRMASTGEGPEEYSSIDLVVNDEIIRLDVLGWNTASIGIGDPVYQKLHRTSIEAYYQISLEHIQWLAEASTFELHTTGSAMKEFVPWYIQDKARNELSEFVRTVQ